MKKETETYRRDILDRVTLKYLNGCDLEEIFIIQLAFIFGYYVADVVLMPSHKLPHLGSTQHYYAGTTDYIITLFLFFQIEKSWHKAIQ